MKRLAFLLALGSVVAKAAGPAAADATVRLFSTRVVASVVIVPVEATLRVCARCAETLVPGRLVVEAAAGRLMVGGKRVESLELTGQLKVSTGEGPVSVGAGRWRIAAAKAGLHVLLTLPSERYVMAVLSSEAGVGDSAEALKALAVVARSFVLTNGARHGVEGVCDSTHCQALRMGVVSTRIEEAVRATTGETLWWKGSRVPGYFSQSCGGMTEDAAELWGGARRPWLVAHADAYCQRDSGQWRVALREAELRQVLEAEGWRVPRVDSVRVVERAGSGRVRKIEVAGGGQRVVLAAATLRFAVDRALGWDRIRSDWYNVSFAGGQVVFEGKGHGHGVGLCQAGASAMAQQGMGYREMLTFYFPGTAVRVEAGDEGWKRVEGKGYSVRSVGDAVAVVAAADRAMERARGLLPGAREGAAVVTVYPTTELFRQGTGEPGWVLASTRGETIGLQPLGVVARRGGLETLLLHEFLHGMVEREAGEKAPLWLREGLVEALAGESGALDGMKVRDVEAGLRRPRDQAEAVRAHKAAGAMVRRMIAERGLAVVREWLRSGVPRGAIAGE